VSRVVIRMGAMRALPWGSVDGTYAHAIRAMQEEAAALIAGPVFARK